MEGGDDGYEIQLVGQPNAHSSATNIVVNPEYFDSVGTRVLPLYPKSFIKLGLTKALGHPVNRDSPRQVYPFRLGISFQIHLIRQTSRRGRMLSAGPAARRDRNSQAMAILFGFLA